MSDGQIPCLYVIDCSGLHEIACTQSGNLKALYLDQISKGVIAVPTRAWDDFKEIYEDEVGFFENVNLTKIAVKKRHQIGAASLADKLNSRLSISSYNSQSDLYTAAIADSDGLQILTTTAQLKYYKNMDCKALDLSTWTNQFGNS